MQTWKVLPVVLLMAAALAGCSEGSGSGFRVTAPDSGPGPFHFKALGKADNYTWDLGDRLTRKYGPEVEHTYDFENGQVTVRLTARTGDATEEFAETLVLGNGQNAPPTLLLEGQTNWAVLGERVRFSGAGSTDPDGDALRFSWNCIRTGDAIRQGVGHSHGPGGSGVPYGTPASGSVASRLAVAPMPAPDLTLEGDLCETLGAGSAPGLADTIEGAFERSGIYDILMLASDPKTPTTSGRFTLYVTDPAERPAPVQSETFTGTLQAGSGGSAQGPCDLAGQSCDRATHGFSLPLAGVATFVNVTYDGGALAGTPAGNVVTVSVLRGANVVQAPESESFVLENLAATAYTLEVVLEQGAQVGYQVQVVTVLNMDPTQVY